MQVCCIFSSCIVNIISMIDKALRLKRITNLAQTFKAKHPQLAGQSVRVVEVGPRDGLQNEKRMMSLAEKINLVDQLSATGLPAVEVGSFVSPKWVPQMASSKELYQQIRKNPLTTYPCLVPNAKGMETAVEIGVKEIAVFASATEGFSQKNLNCSIKQSLERCVPVVRQAAQKSIKVRGYVSMVMGCPFDGEVSPSQVRWVVEQLLKMGCYEVSLGDTVGRGTVEKTRLLFEGLSGLPMNQLAAHFHDTFDKAIQNIFCALELGCRTVDSSVGGLGGCPYSMKPVGNVCTENVLFALEEAGFKTGVDLQKVAAIGREICALLQRPSLSVI